MGMTISLPTEIKCGQQDSRMNGCMRKLVDGRGGREKLRLKMSRPVIAAERPEARLTEPTAGKCTSARFGS